MVASRFSILGSLSVTTEEGIRTSVPGQKNRVLLATLLLHADQCVSVDQLARRLWGDRLPRDPRRVVQTYVVRLRRWLGDGGLIRTRDGGYVMELDHERLDLLEFRRLLRLAARAGRPEDEVALLRRAVGLWRGPACENVESDVLHHLDVPILTEQYQHAVERRVDLELRAGPPGELIAELRALTREHPLRERHWAQLMTALRGCGRRAEALDVYSSVFRTLRDELGIEPGRELRELHEAILSGDDVAFPGVTPPRELPPDVRHFVGRARELRLLDDALAEEGSAARTAVVVGRGGVGKTAMAIRWCASVAGDFPDGQLYLDLRGFDARPALEPADALRALLRGLGVAPGDIPADETAASALFRTRTTGRRLLVLLDNALDTRQVRPLLPGRGPVVVVTSRNQLRGLVASGAATRVVLRPLSDDESAALLAALLAKDPAWRETDQARRLAALAEGLPLALRVIGERLARQPELPLTDLVRDIDADPDAVASGDDAVHAMLSSSYERLDTTTKRVLRLTGGLHPGPVLDPRPVAALVGMPVDRVRAHLDHLVANHLAEQTGPHRYELHRLVRSYAAAEMRRQDTAPQQNAARAALLLLREYRPSAIDAEAPVRF
ncbi:AfsR/SARP family transcriptional regulator [Nonomuraea harbinensis]|uniref:BTAD domain-containing putative transcriptional regulator n=1 Tax=Nonomuraea harbinensis TaxID=1286938 RepID=A0ABW1C0Z8_9ACTN|nr:AfsR/SARP family transcriptional regulator [Nonomuraea harbinensis]